MPRLPSRDDFGARPTPQSRRGITNYTTGVVEQALGNLGQTVGGIGEAIQEREDKFNYARAKSSLLQADVDARSELEQDPDFANHEKKYADRMKAAREQASGMIRSSGDRQAFEIDANNDFIRGSANVKEGAFNKERDWGRGSLQEMLNNNRNSALKAKDKVVSASFIKATNEAIDGARAKGYVNEQEAVQFRQKWTADYAEAWLGMQKVDDQINYLNNPEGTPIIFLSPDKAAYMLDQAQRQNHEVTVTAAGQQFSDEIEDAGGSYSAKLAKGRAIKDPQIRESTITHIKQRQQEREDAQNIADRDNLRVAYKYAEQYKSWDKIPPAVRVNLDPKDARAIKGYLADDNVKTDPETWHALERMRTSDPKRFRDQNKTNILKYRHALSEVDFEYFVKAQSAPDGAEYSSQTDYQRVNNTLSAISVAKDSAKAARFHKMYSEGVNDLQARQGSPATLDQKQKILDGMVMDVEVKGNFFRDPDKRAYEVEDGERLVMTNEDRKAIRAEIIARLSPKDRHGPKSIVSEAEIQKWYELSWGIGR